ncbi:MAG: DUF1893 domain-containing protein [Candidatus Bathyarchaeota archaeon]|jgi:hypothetical protein
MHDLKMARKKLDENGLTLCVVKEDEILFESLMSGISGFLTVVEMFGGKLEGASIADRIVGKAIALLCVYSRVKAVYASVLSMKGKTVFEEHGVHHEWDQLVECVLSVNRVGICPFEKLSSGISDPAKAYEELKAFQGGSSSC